MLRRLPFDGDVKDVNFLAREQWTECGKGFHGVVVFNIVIKLILSDEVSAVAQANWTQR